MAIKIDRALMKTDIREGYATIKSQTMKGKLFWFLPGGGITTDRTKAKEYAKRVDKLMRANLQKSNKPLI